MFSLLKGFTMKQQIPVKWIHLKLNKSIEKESIFFSICQGLG